MLGIGLIDIHENRKSNQKLQKYKDADANVYMVNRYQRNYLEQNQRKKNELKTTQKTLSEEFNGPSQKEHLDHLQKKIAKIEATERAILNSSNVLKKKPELKIS